MVSLIAQQNSDGNLVPFKTLKGNDIILVQSGMRDAKTMMDDELGSLFKSLILFIVGTVACGALAAIFGDIAKKEQNARVTNGKNE